MTDQKSEQPRFYLPVGADIARIHVDADVSLGTDLMHLEIDFDSPEYHGQ